MPPDRHVTHPDRESGGKNRDTISVDVRKRLVFDHITPEQYTYWRVTAKDEGSVESEESSCHLLIQVKL